MPSGRPIRARLRLSLTVAASIAALLACHKSTVSPTVPMTSTGPHLKVFGPQALLIPGESAQLQAMKYGDATVDKTANAMWSSSDDSVATVSPEGLAVARAPGTADISANVDGLTASIGVRVTANHVRASGQIDRETAADILASNQEPGGVLGNQHPGVIQRFNLPIRIYVDPAFAAAFGGVCVQQGVDSWRSSTGLPIVYTEVNSGERIQMVIEPIDDHRPRTFYESVYLDNSYQNVKVIIPTSWSVPSKPGWCPDPYQDTIRHELGHALGIIGEPDWGGVMAYGKWAGLRSPSAREVRFVVALYSLPIGAHVNPDGSWVL
jgi:hypothetical protein